MAVFVAGGEEGDRGFSLCSPQPFFVGLCNSEADEAEELYRGFRKNIDNPGCQMGK